MVWPCPKFREFALAQTPQRHSERYFVWTDNCGTANKRSYRILKSTWRTIARGESMTYRGVGRLISFFALVLAGASGTALAQASGGTHSPHGNLNVPCQNCH